MTSPHISCIRERIRVNNRLISENDFADRLDNLLNIENVINILQKDEKPNDEPFEASFFEIMTVLGFDYFAQMKCNFAVIEVGLGYVCFVFSFFNDESFSRSRVRNFWKFLELS